MVISGNYAGSGGGIYNYEDILNITGSTISNNFSEYGGGIYYDFSTLGSITIGGDSEDEKNTICGTYKSSYYFSLDGQVGYTFGSIYEIYKHANYISDYC